MHQKSREGFTVDSVVIHEVASKPGFKAWPGISLAAARIAGQVVPGAEVARAWPAAFVRNVGWRAPELSFERMARGSVPGV